MKKILVPIWALYICVCFYSCAEDIEGCTDPASDSFNSEATVDDGTCRFLRDDYVGIYGGFLDGDDDRFDMRDFQVQIGKSAQGNNIVSIGFPCCPKVKYKAIVSQNKIEIDDMVAVENFPGCDGINAYDGTPFDGYVRWAGDWIIDDNLNISFTNMLEQYIEEEGQIICNTNYSANLERI